MQEKERLSREEIISLYQGDTMKLLKYLKWVEKVTGQNTSNLYTGEGIEETSMAVPVYDSTLLSFVREAKETVFMNRNYVYTFSQYRLNTTKDELKMIQTCTLQEVKILGDILSKYILKGEVKGAYWSEGIKSGVFLELLLKLKELLEIRQPLA